MHPNELSPLGQAGLVVGNTVVAFTHNGCPSKSTKVPQLIVLSSGFTHAMFANRGIIGLEDLAMANSAVHME